MKKETKKVDIRYDIENIMIQLADTSSDLVDIDEWECAEDVEYARNILSAVCSKLRPD